LEICVAVAQDKRASAMTSALHFKFKSAKQFETLTFDGDYLKVADLKVAIVERKRLNFGEGFDLDIMDAQTGERMSGHACIHSDIFYSYLPSTPNTR
jgi:hypothetical protein